MKYRFYKSPHPYLCFASCLRTIIEGYSGIETDEFEIGDELGVTVPKDDESHIYGFTQSNLSEDWGVNVDTEKINSLLRGYHAGINCSYHSANTFEDYAFDDFVRQSLSDNNMVIFGFDYNSLFKMSSTAKIGHAVVGISSIVKKTTLGINIYDPGPRFSAQKQVDSFDMYVSCKRKGGGIWTFAPSL
jgi:hypothetical protein